MRKAFTVTGAVIAAVCALLAAIFASHRVAPDSATVESEPQAAGGAASAERTSSESAESEGISLREGPSAPLRAPARAGAEDPPAAFRVDTLWGAETVEDSAWLQANGFPDSAALVELTGTSEELLRHMAARGDRHAQRMADYKALRRTSGSPDFEASLFEAAADGDVFALQLLAWYHLQASGPESRILGLAYNRVLAWRGFHAAVLSSHLHQQGLSADQLLAVEVYSLAIFNRLQQLRIQRTGRPFPVDPKPGLDALMVNARAGLNAKTSDAGQASLEPKSTHTSR